MLQVSVHHGDDFTAGHLETSAHCSPQAALALTGYSVHKADFRVGKHRLADRGAGAVVRVIDEDELPIQATGQERTLQPRDQRRDIGCFAPGRDDDRQGAPTVPGLAARVSRRGSESRSGHAGADGHDGQSGVGEQAVPKLGADPHRYDGKAAGDQKRPPEG